MSGVSTEGIREMPRGVTPGDRWAVLEKTSPSGKTMFRCMSCGSEDVTPRKYCWVASNQRPANLVDQREVSLACVTWMPDKLYRYSLPSEGIEGWAYIVLSARGYFSAVSDFGNYAFMWPHHGEKDFRLFLLNAQDHWDYFASKLCPKMEYDGVKTVAAVKQYLLDCRRGKSISREAAREEWELLEHYTNLYSEDDFNRWFEETSIPDAHEYYTQSYPAHVVTFCQRTLQRLSDVLEKDLLREGLLLREEPRP